MSGVALVHDVVNHLAHLILIFLKHTNLRFHELGLAVHEGLRDDVDVLCLHKLLPHLVEEVVHLLVGHLLDLVFMVIHHP